MNNGAFSQLLRIIEKNPESVVMGMPATDEAIKAAQDFLQVHFPEHYVKFLKTWGTLSIGTCEFYGIAGTDFQKNTVPNGIWFTAIKRKRLSLPSNLIIISDNNGDEYYCVDARSEKIVVWNVLDRTVTSTKSNDIFNFILDESKDWL